MGWAIHGFGSESVIRFCRLSIRVFKFVADRMGERREVVTRNVPQMVLVELD